MMLDTLFLFQVEPKVLPPLLVSCLDTRYLSYLSVPTQRPLRPPWLSEFHLSY
jgi:hypothetical protein